MCVHCETDKPTEQNPTILTPDDRKNTTDSQNYPNVKTFTTPLQPTNSSTAFSSQSYESTSTEKTERSSSTQPFTEVTYSSTSTEETEGSHSTQSPTEVPYSSTSTKETEGSHSTQSPTKVPYSSTSTEETEGSHSTQSPTKVPYSSTAFNSSLGASTSGNNLFSSDSPTVLHSQSNSLTSAITGASAAIGTLLFCIMISLFLLTLVVLRRKSNKTVINLSNGDNEASIEGARVHSTSLANLNRSQSLDTLRENHMSIHADVQTTATFPQFLYGKELPWNQDAELVPERIQNPFYDSRDTVSEDEPPKYEAISDLNMFDCTFHANRTQSICTDTPKKKPLQTRSKTPPPVPPRVPIPRKESNTLSFDLGIMSNGQTSGADVEEASDYTLLGEYFSGTSLTSAASYLALEKIASQENIHPKSPVTESQDAILQGNDLNILDSSDSLNEDGMSSALSVHLNCSLSKIECTSFHSLSNSSQHEEGEVTNEAIDKE